MEWGGAGAALSPCVGSWGRRADTVWHSQRPPAETRARSPALGALPEGVRAPCAPRRRLHQGCDCSLRFPAFTTAHGPSLLPGEGGGSGCACHLCLSVPRDPTPSGCARCSRPRLVRPPGPSLGPAHRGQQTTNPWLVHPQWSCSFIRLPRNPVFLGS